MKQVKKVPGRLLAILLAGTLLLSGCSGLDFFDNLFNKESDVQNDGGNGGEDEGGDDADGDNADAAVNNSGGSETESVDFVTSDSNVEVPIIEVEVTQEILDAGPYDCKVQVGNVVMTPPVSFLDFMNAGAVLTDTEVMESTMVPAMTEKSIQMQFSRTPFQLLLANDTDTHQQVVQCGVRYFASSSGPDLIYPGGVAVGTALDELLQKWGQPTNEAHGDESILQYMEYPVPESVLTGIMSGVLTEQVSATGYTYQVKLDRTSEISDIQCRWISKSPDAQPVDIQRGLSSGKTFSATIPYYFYQNPLPGEYKYMTVYLIADAPYTIVIDSDLGEGIAVQSGGINEVLQIALPPAEESGNFEFDILSQDGADQTIFAYRHTEAYSEGIMVVVRDGMLYHSSGSLIFPSEEGGAMSETAARAFRAILTEYLQTINVD